jgi:uncharacterized damage-inducible protein DinB
MPIVDPLKQEMEMESRHTRRTLERVPENALDWQPHPKSFTMRRLAAHLVESVGWAKDTIVMPGYDMDPATYKPWTFSTRAELLEKFDGSLAATLKAMDGVSDEAMMANWALKANGQVLFEMPRALVFRSMILNHIIHHRAQLGVYLRLRDVPVPAIYGPSADEQP